MDPGKLVQTFVGNARQKTGQADTNKSVLAVIFSLSLSVARDPEAETIERN